MVWGLIVTRQLRWYLRPQPFGDVGIDAHVEPVVDGRASGRLLAMQIKSGPSQFLESAPGSDGWVHREGSRTHRDYWLRYQLPVLLVLYDVENQVAHWQRITPDTAVMTRVGFKVVVPASQRLDTAAATELAGICDDPLVVRELGHPSARDTSWTMAGGTPKPDHPQSPVPRRVAASSTDGNMKLVATQAVPASVGGKPVIYQACIWMRSSSPEAVGAAQAAAGEFDL
jgi:hypothetical protein